MGFKDTFGKDSSDSNLQYDDGAFYYFIFCLLLLVALPLFYSLVKQVFKFKTSQRACRCQDCKEKESKLLKENRFKWIDKWFLLKVIFIFSS